MQSKAKTVSQYLAELPEDRRQALEAVRAVILKNLDPDMEEGMQYGMIGYYIPHRVFPAGYHCDPKQPLPFGGLASQKNHMSLYFMCLYAEGKLLTWFEKEWAKTGRKLDMGKCCVRFKKLEDVALDVVGELVRRVSAKDYISHYEASIRASNKKASVQAAKTKTGPAPPRRGSSELSVAVRTAS